MKARYIVGIDLGTTNSAVAYVDLHDARPGSINILTFNIPQLVSQGRVAERPALPSFLYLPGEYDFQAGATSLPWDPERAYVVGSFARDHGGLVPGRLVSSGKSWLCHGGVDREAPILPWGAGDEMDKVSPITASSQYLQHIREAWDYNMPEPLETQMVVLTVPASFDEVARELTLRAAKEAGLPAVTLLEEPLAAFYAWLSFNEGQWNTFLQPGDLLLVCDVGGGTTDFTLISCEGDPDIPKFERVAVGDHLLLGGDNMDLSLATLAEKAIGQELDTARWNTLYHQCRQAKETLLKDGGPEKVTLRLTGRGRSLIGGTLTTDLRLDQVNDVIVEGFFPEVDLKAGGFLERGETGLREMGLPYVSEPAVTRHLARFLLRQGGGRMPTVVLFNGGALKPGLIRNRLEGILTSWSGHPVRVLDSRSLDLAISWGAAYYGLVTKGLGLRVGGGMARSYFVGVALGVEDRAPMGVCLVERGTEEGKEVEVLKTFRVQTNRPVKFSLYSSTTRKGDKVGDLVPVDSEDLIELPPLQTVLHYGKKGRDAQIPIRLGAKVTAIGTLELYCESQESSHRWRLQFQLRDSEINGAADSVSKVEGVLVAPSNEQMEQGPKGLSEDDLHALEKARKEIRKCFVPDKSHKAIAPSELPGRLTECMGMEKDLWSLPILRALADSLLDIEAGYAISPQHEARWYNLAGFCLRPGTGEATDPWRVKKIWPFYFDGLVFSKETEPRLQWWIFWRRVAAGLSSGQQTQIFSAMSSALLPVQSKRRKRAKVKPVKVSPQERCEMWLFAANLERLETSSKIELGREIISNLVKNRWWQGALWALSRIGSRQPLYGPANKVVPPGEIASWLEALKKIEMKQPRKLIKAAVSMARLTGDRTRDLQTAFREEIITWLQLLGAGEKKLEPLRKAIPLAGKEKNHAFGESLPEGLILEQVDDK
nr:molecular chaperone DnaK [Deltaproteobacteria bacterium]